MTKKLDFFHPEFTLRSISIKLLLSQNIQHLSQVLCMFFFTLGVYQDVIDEHHHKLIQERPEHTIHIVHEYRRCVRNSKRHNKVLVVTITILKSGLRYISLLHSDLVISRLQIYLQENSGSPKLIHQIIYLWHR